jgi:hypothetical protein
MDSTNPAHKMALNHSLRAVSVPTHVPAKESVHSRLKCFVDTVLKGISVYKLKAKLG